MNDKKTAEQAKKQSDSIRVDEFVSTAKCWKCGDITFLRCKKCNACWGCCNCEY